MKRAAVAEPGQRIGHRLLAARGQQLHALAEREHGADDDRGDRGRRERDRERVDPDEVVVDEQREPDEGEERRQRQRLPAFVAHAFEPADRLPGRARDQRQPQRPADVERAAFLVRPGCGLVEVRAVDQREDREADRDECPSGVEAPAGQGERGDDEREQQHVGERIGEVRGDDERAPARRLQTPRRRRPPLRARRPPATRSRRRGRGCRGSPASACAGAAPGRHSSSDRTRDRTGLTPTGSAPRPYRRTRRSSRGRRPSRARARFRAAARATARP